MPRVGVREQSAFILDSHPVRWRTGAGGRRWGPSAHSLLHPFLSLNVYLLTRSMPVTQVARLPLREAVRG